MKTKRAATYYDILGVTPNANDGQIRQAYHQLARKWHPDMNPKNRKHAAQHFNMVHMAYAHLRTKPQRAAYDRLLARRRLQKTALKAANNNRPESGPVRFFTNVKEIFWPIAPKQETSHNG